MFEPRYSGDRSSARRITQVDREAGGRTEPAIDGGGIHTDGDQFFAIRLQLYRKTCLAADLTIGGIFAGWLDRRPSIDFVISIHGDRNRRSGRVPKTRCNLDIRSAEPSHPSVADLPRVQHGSFRPHLLADLVQGVLQACGSKGANVHV